MTTLTRNLLLIAIGAFANLFETEGFAIQNQNTNPFITRRNAITQLHLSSLESSTIMLTLSSPILSTALSSVSAETPSIASELMGDASHVGDFLSLFDFPKTPLAPPAIAATSRIFCIVSDYLPDHNILPVEFAYHTLMLTIASASIFKTVKDIVATKDYSLTMQDRRCFVTLFRPVGLSWVQYKRLFEAGVFEWKELAPESVIISNEMVQDIHTNEEDFYWLQSGSVKIKSEGHNIKTITSKSRYLFGNLQASLSKDPITPTTMTNGLHPGTTIGAGMEGAKVLRIDALKLKELTEQDQALKTSVRSMLLKGMHSNIAALTI